MCNTTQLCVVCIGDEADGAVWDSSGHIDTNKIEEYKKAARNLGRDAGEKAPRFQ